jgi:hypothetical protein
MKYWLIKIILLLVCCSICLVSTTSEAKKRCRPLLEKLHNVQTLQRNGYDLKKGKALRKREDKAREKWWQCERSSSFKKSKKLKSKSKKNKNKTRKKSKKREKTSKKFKNVPAPFSNNKTIEVRSKYPREKLFSWLNYYQRPEGCHKPKDLATFAFCSEDKLSQQGRFEQQYKN